MSIFDYEELAYHVCGIDMEDLEAMEDRGEETDLDVLLDEKLGVDFVQFTKIVDCLLPLATVGQSPICGSWYRGFAALDKDKKHYTWLLQQPVNKTVN